MKSLAELAAEQATLWNGPGGQGWLASQKRIERSISGFGQAALAEAAARPGEQVIDVGCGPGGTTAALARAVAPTGHVLGVDISQVLIDKAREQRLDNVTFAVGDAAAHPFETARHNLVFSRFGVMFFADPVVAFGNLLRALKPAGRLVFVCWRTPQENPWGLVPFRAAQPFLPPVQRPGPEEPGQYAFGDRARVERILMQAGFAAPAFTPLDRSVWMADSIAEFLDGAQRFGVLAKPFAEAAPADVERAKAAITAALTPHQGPDGITLPGACWLVSARAQ
ncbi:methyltransferase domain-containing protein [soil metagenome]